MAIIDNLVAAWEMDEAGSFDDRVDSHGSSYLTWGGGAVPSTTGVVGNAAQFGAGGSWLQRGSGADVQTGDVDFTFAFMLKVRTFTGVVTRGILTKAGDTDGEYLITWPISGQVPLFGVYGAAGYASGTSVSASTFGSWTTGEWRSVICWHDAGANEIAIEVNGVADTASHSAGVYVGTYPFQISRGAYWIGEDQDVDGVFFWKRVLTSDERTWLRNGGAWRSYADVVTGMGGGGDGQPAVTRWGGVPHLGTQKFRGGHRGGPWAMRRSGVIVPTRFQEAA